MVKIDLAEFAEGGIIREESFRAKVAALDGEQFRDQEVFIKGCAKLPIPTWAFMIITAHVAQTAASISFGEEARPQMLFLRAPAPAK